MQTDALDGLFSKTAKRVGHLRKALAARERERASALLSTRKLEQRVVEAQQRLATETQLRRLLEAAALAPGRTDAEAMALAAAVGTGPLVALLGLACLIGRL